MKDSTGSIAKFNRISEEYYQTEKIRAFKNNASAENKYTQAIEKYGCDVPGGEVKSFINTTVTARDDHHAVVMESIKRVKDCWKPMKLDRETEERKLTTANFFLWFVG